EVLEAQQQLFPAENALSQIEAGRRLAVVQLYKALGGGWSLKDYECSGMSAQVRLPYCTSTSDNPTFASEAALIKVLEKLKLSTDPKWSSFFCSFDRGL